MISWRRVLGAFQIKINVSTKQQLLVPEEHQLALFRWIAQETSPRSRWFPVMQRYISQLAGRVSGFGGNPGTILPSPIGSIPSTGPHGHHPKGHDHDHDRRELSGKVNGLVFDHFGDFEGFILETRLGEFERFYSREKRMEEIVREALEHRNWITVTREPGHHDRVLEIVLRTR